MSGTIQLEAITKVEGKKQTKWCFENSIILTVLQFFNDEIAFMHGLCIFKITLKKELCL